MSSFWNTEVTAGQPLIEEALLKFFEDVKNAKPHPCSRGEHVISAKARYRLGIYPCANCGYPVDVRMPLSEVR